MRWKPAVPRPNAWQSIDHLDTAIALLNLDAQMIVAERKIIGEQTL